MLWGLLSLSIPIIVHLFNFRKHKVLIFPFTSFLNEVKTESQKQSRIRHWIILLLRLLALTSLVIAFAQPILPNDQGNSGKKLVSIYIDNSFSMENQKNGISLLENAKNKALDIVFAYNENDAFQIISNEFSGIQQHFVTKDKAVEIIQSIQNSCVTRTYDEVYERQKDLLFKENTSNKKAFWISDFQKNNGDLSKLENHSEILLRWIPIQNSETPNVFVDSIYFETPAHAVGQEEKLFVVLKNSGQEQDKNVRCEININQQNKGVTNIDIPANSAQTVSFSITPQNAGFQLGKIILNDQPIVFDNNYFFSYEVKEKKKIGIISSGDAHAKKVFQNDPYFETTTYNSSNIDINEWLQNDFLIIESPEALSSGFQSIAIEAVKKGAHLLFIPNSVDHRNTDQNFYDALGLSNTNTTIATRAQGNQIDWLSPLFKNVFDAKDKFQLPYSESHLKFTVPNNASSPITYPDNSPLLIDLPLGSGRVFIFNVSYDKTNLFSHSIFPIALLRMSELASREQPLSFTLGQKEPLILKDLQLEGNEQLKLIDHQTKDQLLPLVRNIGNNTEISIGSYIPQGGHYDVFWKQIVYTLGINADPKESQLQFWTESEMQNSKDQITDNTNIEIVSESIGNIGTYVSKLDDGKHYWWYLIAISILCLLTESILMGIWKM
jgi:hypothetical protein